MAAQPKAWICTVCGHIHTGDTPPACCVLCGAGSDLFEPYVEPQSAVPETVSQWRCLLCDYVADGDEPPEVCPVCGAPADQFEAYQPDAVPAIPDTHDTETFVVVGAGIAGISAAQTIRKASSDARIIVLSKEMHLPYYRLNLTRYLAGEITSNQLPLHDQSWYDSNRIELKLGAELCTVDVQAKSLKLRNGDTLSYDKLILAMGSHPFVPPVPGVNRENVTVVRTLQDTEQVLAQVRPETRVVVIGGGLLGLEAAGALANKVASVSVMEGFGWLLPRQLNQAAAEHLQTYVQGLGITLHLNVKVKEIVGDERARAVVLESGEEVPADLVILSTGVRSNSYVARLAGLEVHHGIVVNNHLQTSEPDIYAAGDVAEHQGVVYGIWGPAQFQGTTAGLNAAGQVTEFTGIPRSNMLKVLGFDLFSIGDITPEDASYDVIEGMTEGHYVSFIFHDSCLTGAILLGDTSVSAQVKHAIEQQRDGTRILQSDRTLESVMMWLKA